MKGWEQFSHPFTSNFFHICCFFCSSIFSLIPHLQLITMPWLTQHTNFQSFHHHLTFKSLRTQFFAVDSTLITCARKVVAKKQKKYPKNSIECVIDGERGNEEYWIGSETHQREDGLTVISHQLHGWRACMIQVVSPLMTKTTWPVRFDDFRESKLVIRSLSNCSFNYMQIVLITVIQFLLVALIQCKLYSFCKQRQSHFKHMSLSLEETWYSFDWLILLFLFLLFLLSYLFTHTSHSLILLMTLSLFNTYFKDIEKLWRRKEEIEVKRVLHSWRISSIGLLTVICLSSFLPSFFLSFSLHVDESNKTTFSNNF